MNEVKDLQAQIEASGTRLLEKIMDGPSEHYLNYLRFASKFHNYSANNQMLIWINNPSATRVAGYRAWEKLGFQVAKGQKGIRILAPRFGKKEKNGEEESFVYFVVVSVFDASQLTEPEKVPSFFYNLEDSDVAERLYSKLNGALAKIGVDIQERVNLGSAEGWSSNDRSIKIRSDRPATNRFLTLIHEACHSLLHWNEEYKDTPKSILELEAESAAFIVSAHFGVDNPFSADYVTLHRANFTDYIKCFKAIQKISARIIGLIESEEN